jgi:hypothetical protein
MAPLSTSVLAMIKKTLLTATIALAASAGLAGAQNEPSSYATAQIGTLKVVSGVVLAPKAADMRGVWLDDKVSCSVNRKLTVRAQIVVSPLSGAGPSHRVSRSGTFLDVNCAEGGPNVGFTISAKAAKSACPSGTWKPGQYSFTTTTTEPTRKLKALASLGWTKRGRC